MDPADYTHDDAGRVVQTPQGYAAFVPAPLPPELVYDPVLVLALSRADAALSELAGLGRTLPNPHLLIQPYVRREAVLSSRIEGTRADVADVLLDELVEPGQAVEEDLREVRNYITALEYGIERLSELPLSLRLVREIHGKLLEGVRGNVATPGEFRRSQNWIGAPGSTLATAAYVPPPLEHLMDCLSDWERFAHERDTLPELIQCALLHEQFEAIHPFLDGNGRVGRLLITLFLIERGRLDQPLLYLSEYIEAHRQGYYDSLQRVRTHADWRGWLMYFLEGVAVTAKKGVVQAGKLFALREELREKLRSKPRAVALLDALFDNPYVTALRVQELLEVSDPTARQVIAYLEREGVLIEKTGRSWGKVYVAIPILAALEARS
ncbi:Fic family protein [Armatimonas rosea]|uniref:Fic family protein n=1 Tax=Armatimonas rosea TaxID=685828 RepID=A0A7W9SQP0_ARMRO|nr:Fic family protein [Armatimonas rosea]MBB6050439.1 Fic family protein [Armatimonas rosea]